MTATQTLPARLDYDTYARLERNSEVRHELAHGVRIPMVGGTDLHNLIAGNLVVLLKLALRGHAYRVYFSDVTVRIGDNVRYPDVFVTPAADNAHPLYKTQPILVAEVLSDSTARLDRGAKFDDYRQLPSLQHYLLLSQSAVQIEHFARSSQWAPTVLGSGTIVELPALDIRLPTDALYEDTGLGISESP